MIARLLGGLVIGGCIGALMGYFGKCNSGMCPLTANPFRGAIFGALLGTMFALSFRGRQNKDLRPIREPETSAGSISANVGVKPESKQEAVIHVNNETDFRKHILEAEIPCLVDFFSDSCPPCRRLAPTINTLGSKYNGKAIICKVSLDHVETRGLARQYRIMGIPAVLFFENGKETQRLVGLRSEGEYSNVLDQMIRKNTDQSKTE